jgi:hypothetical protein
MKFKLLLWAVLLSPIVVFSQINPKSDVMPMGNGIYIISKHGATGFTPLGKLRKKAYEAANEYASQNDAIAEVVSVNETKAGYAVWPQVDLKFRLVKKSEKTASTNNTSVTVSSGYDANGQKTDGQIILKNPNQDEKDRLEKLEKIGKLFKDGILSKEEFESEKKKILSGN